MEGKKWVEDREEEKTPLTGEEDGVLNDREGVWLSESVDWVWGQR